MNPLSAGKPLVSPAFDYLVIGGGLGAVVALAVWAAGPAGAAWLGPRILPLFLFANFAHFGASTVRLYTKPRAFEDFPGLTAILPLASFALVFVVIAYAERLGRSFNSLYLTWSPFHYAAQTFGLAVWYGRNSGWNLSAGERRALYAGCLMPFFYAFFDGAYSDMGLGMFLPPRAFAGHPLFKEALDAARRGLVILTFVAPALLVTAAHFRRRVPVPAIIPLLLVSNGLFWTVLRPLNAFIIATIFHGLQYLGIVIYVHLKDRDGEAGKLASALTFYGLSLSLGYALFRLWPYAYEACGFGYAESLIVVTAAINIHHFFVDGFIWRQPAP